MTTGQRRDYVRDGADIYRRSFAIIRAEADLGRFSPAEEPVAVRIIHASGMVEVAADIVAQLDPTQRMDADPVLGTDILARAKGFADFLDAGFFRGDKGKPVATDHRAPVWEATHHLIRALNTQGETAAGALLAAMPDKAEPIRQLAYHLYTLCERKKWAEDARAYNELITAWHAVLEASREQGPRGEQLGFDA